jgi:hypothetical protein
MDHLLSPPLMQDDANVGRDAEMEERDWSLRDLGGDQITERISLNKLQYLNNFWFVVDELQS